MENFLPAVLWLSCCYLIVGSSIRICRHCFGDESVASQFLHVTVITVAIIIPGLTIQGACGLLFPVVALLLPTAMACAAWQLLKRRPPARVQRRDEKAPDPLPVCFWALVAGVLFGHSLVNGVLQFPTDWDTLMYHLPYIDHWLQTGSLAATESPRWSNPANSELLGLWFAIPFSGDFLVPLNNLPVVILWVAAAIELSRLFGLSGWWPHLAAAACIAVHTTVHETDDASNDLMVPACFLASVYYAIRFRQSQTPAHLMFFGMTLGLLAGTKFFAAGYALLSGIAFAAMCYGRLGLIRTLRTSLLAVGISLLFGGYWYARNFWITGHVFYPSGSADLHRRIPHPDLPRTTLAWNDDPRVPEYFLDAIWRLCGPLHFAATLLLPTIPLLVSLACWHDRSRRRRSGLLFFLLLGTAALTLATPMLVEDQPGTLNHLRWGYTPVRYSLCFLCIMMLSTTVAVSEIARRTTSGVGRRMQQLFALAVVAQLAYRFWSASTPAHPDAVGQLNMPTPIAAGAITLLLAGAILVVLRRRLCSPLVVAITTGSMLSVLICFAGHRWDRDFAAFYNAYYSTVYFTTHAEQPTRLLILDERSYPFFGSRRQNYLFQPMLFDGVTETRRLMQAKQLSMVVTRIENHKLLARYRPSWEALDKDPAFEQTGKGVELRVFTLKQDADVGRLPGSGNTH